MQESKNNLQKKSIKMTNQTQKQWIVEQLNKSGFITRNQCLKNFITRLGAIIFKLKNEGFEFDSFYQENNTLFGTEKDFVYKWLNPPNEIEVKNEFTFFWLDADNNETPAYVPAGSFAEACDLFLMNTPIFMVAIYEEVEDRIGGFYRLDTHPKFNNLKTYSKPKKRKKNE